MSVRSRSNLDRRSVIHGGGMLIGGFTIAGPLQSLFARQALAVEGQTDPVPGPFGGEDRIRPVDDRSTMLPLLQLPRGFRYRSFSWTGDRMADGNPTPARHDGMAVVGWDPNGTITLIRNHEVAFGPRLQAPLYDNVEIPGELIDPSLQGSLLTLGGGTTTLTFQHRRWREARPSLGGTVANCAGGPTPWGSWLTCEETVSLGEAIGGRTHGFVFEVPTFVPASAQPLIAMGLMRHEAVAVDLWTSIVYLTEDNGDTSGFFRFLPNDATGNVGSLSAGGRLQMLSVLGEPNADLGKPEQGAIFQVSWVDIPDPLALPDDVSNPILTNGRSGPYRQGEERGGARFVRGEGCWYHDGVVYFADTAGGPNRDGVIWCYRPDPSDPAGGGRLQALFVSSSRIVGNSPDNLTVSPDGTILFCEDGGGAPMRIMGLTPKGESFVVAKNNVVLDDSDIDRVGRTGQFEAGDYTGSEWAGVCFDPTGKILFVNIQSPGITFAIWGPWDRLGDNSPDDDDDDD